MTAWTREQQLVALRLYLTEPFGKLHKTNPRIVALAKTIGRSPSALSMKAGNFAHLDPTFRATGRKGLSGASEADEAIWKEFSANRASFIEVMESIVEPVLERVPKRIPQGDSERLATVKVRRHQRFFQEELHATYGGRCAVTGLDVPELLTASHIIPWKESESRRTDPSNGILLNALLDRAFDRGLISFDRELRLICSALLKKRATPEREVILQFERAPLRPPDRSAPDPAALAWHRARWKFPSVSRP